MTNSRLLDVPLRTSPPAPSTGATPAPTGLVDLSEIERANLDRGAWFAELSPALRSDILARVQLRRLPDGTALAARGQAPDFWWGVASGAVRISSVASNGRPVALTYIEPGAWFGDIALIDGLPRSHDAVTHGPTALLVVNGEDFKALLERHVELYQALLRLAYRRMRALFTLLEDLNTRSLRARLARQLLSLGRLHGVSEREGLRIGLSLSQEDVAHLLGASRQRVNQELKRLEREGLLRVEPTRLILLATEPLAAIADS